MKGMPSLALKRWRPYLDNPGEAWEFLHRVASATSGREVEVRQGSTPQVQRVFPKEYFSQILLPGPWLRAGKEHLLHGGLCHELLHVLKSDYKPFVGAKWAVYLMANALEDARIEHQARRSWPGLVRPIEALLREVVDYRLRQRPLAYSSESVKIYEVGLALYLLLSRLEDRLIRETVPEMALYIAEELLPIAEEALTAPDTAGVVEIAKRLIDELERAAERAARKAGTARAYQYARSLSQEVKQALRVTVEEMFARLQAEQQRLEGWYGPWSKGGGGYAFYPVKWEWAAEDLDPLAVPARRDLWRILMEADPLIELQRTRERELVGRLAPSSSALVRAFLGEPYVFERDDPTKRLVLPHVLSLTEFVLVIEAHQMYSPSRWVLLKSVVAAIARLLDELRVPFAVRAFTASRKRVKEEIVNPKTKERRVRIKYEHYIHIATLKGPEEPWGPSAETGLAALPRQGFNQPLEGYQKAVHWGLTFPKTRRTRFCVCFGDALAQDYNRPGGVLNVYPGHLRYATAPLRGEGRRAIYVHLGRSISPYLDSALYRELSSHFDGVVQAGSVKEAVIGLLHAVLIQLASSTQRS